MFGQGNQTYQRVGQLIDAWRPSQDYGHESKFQNELAEFLDEQLNEQTGGGLGEMMGVGGGGNKEVHRNFKELEALGVIEYKREGASKKPQLRGGAETIDFSFQIDPSTAGDRPTTPG